MENVSKSMTFASSLTSICEVNSSFDAGILKVCYVGENRHKSSIDKDTMKNCIKTIYNCPLVCSYDRESDSLGGHDMEVYKDKEGKIRLVNKTQPVGVIPESARVWFEEDEDENGVVHEYLFTEVVLWKRQEAYKKIKEDGITSHSMEINILAGKKINGIFHITDFEFTAFALIGVAPCYESSSLEVFSLSDFKQEMSAMMQDLKDSFIKVNTSKEEKDTKTKIFSKEGGDEAMDKKQELVEKYGIDVKTLDFSIEDFTLEELEQKFEEIKSSEEFACKKDKEKCEEDEEKLEDEEEVKDENEDEEDFACKKDKEKCACSDKKDEEDEEEFACKKKEKENFTLTEEIIREAHRVICDEKVRFSWGEGNRYEYIDIDLQSCQIYCMDRTDWLLYGFSFELNGDSIVLNKDSKKRMKYAIVEFEEGDQVSPFASTAEAFNDAFASIKETEQKFEEANSKIKSLETELFELRKFKADSDEKRLESKREELFSQFSDLEGIEQFVELKNDRANFSLDELRKECFAIRGEFGMTTKFSYEEKAPKQKVPAPEVNENEPYGGLFIKYGTNK